MLPAVGSPERELQHRLNPGKAPHAATDEVRQVVGVLDVVLLLIGDQEFRKAPIPERREAVFPALDGVDFIKLLRANLPFGRELDIIPGFHKEQHVIGVLLNRFPVGTSADAFGEAEMIRHQTLQTLKDPEEDAFQLAAHFLRDVGVIHPVWRALPGGQNQLAAIEAVAAVVEGLEIAIAE